jgi:two-component system response regulator YesN
VTELRISASKELLKDPFLSATEIANAVGYESLNYYTRVFKKTTGVTPTEYRRNQGAPVSKEEES